MLILQEISEKTVLIRKTALFDPTKLKRWSSAPPNSQITYRYIKVTLETMGLSENTLLGLAYIASHLYMEHMKH